MYRYIQPNIKLSFEHQIRRAYLCVEASAWSDEDGVHKTELNDVFLDGISVIALLTEDDLSEIDDAIVPAIYAQDDNEFIPERDAHRLGD